MRRVVRREDLGTATLFAHYFHSNGSDTIPGSTTLGVSTAVLRSLKRSGTAEVGLVEGGNHAYPADRSQAPNLYDYEENWTLRRVGTVPVRVTVNDAMVTLPAIHARGSYLGAKVDFWFLDDEESRSRSSTGSPAAARCRASPGTPALRTQCPRTLGEGSDGKSRHVRVQQGVM